MDRRKFIKTSLLAGTSGAAALSAASCSSLRIPKVFTASSIPLPDMDQYIAGMDSGMEEISSFDFIEAMPGKANTPELKKANHFARNAVKSLYVTAMFSDLPPEGQSHPGMQRRMMLALPEIDLAASEMDEYFSTHSTADNARLQNFLLSPEDPGLQFLEKFNSTAADLGVCNDRRLQTRAMMTRIMWRLKRQSPELMIQEYELKLEKLQATNGVDEAARLHMSTMASEEAFWHWQQQQAVAQDDDPEPLAPMDDKDDENLDQYKDWTEIPGTEKKNKDGEEKDKRSNTEAGARLMGIGLAVFAVSGILVFAGAYPFLIAMTVGAVMFLIGLLRLLAGLAGGS
jgi:hypothetical protein